MANYLWVDFVRVIGKGEDTDNISRYIHDKDLFQFIKDINYKIVSSKRQNDAINSIAT
jgi:hypothetical protein